MSFDRKRTLWESGFVTPALFGVRAGNITPMTITGTNTFIVHAPGSPDALVVDPGPADVEHLRTVMSAVGDRGARIAGIFVTHTHWDHIAGTDLLRHLVEHGPGSVDPGSIPPELDGNRFLPQAFGRRARASFPEGGIPVYAADLGNCPEGPFEPFEGCPRLDVVALPGHSDDMVGLVLRDDRTMLTGDHIFRFWSSVVPYGDGNLADYLRSLDKLQHLVRDGIVDQLAPAHGFPIDQPVKAIEGYRAHRLERLGQVREIVESATGFDPEAVVNAVYGDISDEMLWKAAIASTLAQLEYLADEKDTPLVPDTRLLVMEPPQ